MRASINALRTTLRVASPDGLDDAIALIVFYIVESKPYPETLAKLLEPIEGDTFFNQRLALLRIAASV